VLALLAKFALGKATGFLQVVPISKSPLDWAGELPYLFRNLWILHFYKATWALTPLVWLGLGFLAVISLGKLSPERLAVLLLWPTVLALPLAANRYPAPRAFYGPIFVESLVFAYLAYTALQSPSRRRATFGLALIGVAFALQWADVLRVKSRNFALLEAERAEVSAKLRECEAPCALVLPQPGAGVARDWVLPQFVWPFYYDRIRMLTVPGKDVEIRIAGKDDGTPR
jgi:hypothetical protein